MYRLVESIKIENGLIFNLEYHQERMDRSVYNLTGGKNSIKLSSELSVPREYTGGLFKCRVVYDKSIELVEFIPYTPRTIGSLRIVHSDIDYSCKYEDRNTLNELFNCRGGCDDVLIIKDGCVTDASSANITFYDGSRWFTPARPLLAGTKRSRLLKEGFLAEKDISVDDIKGYTHASLINAMVEHGTIIIPVEQIRHS